MIQFIAKYFWVAVLIAAVGCTVYYAPWQFFVGMIGISSALASWVYFCDMS